MFGPKHYVPILRWKQGERLALRALRPEDRNRIAPLIELPQKMFEARKKQEEDEADTPEQGFALFPEAEGQKPDLGQVLLRAAKGILEAWQNSRFFLDLCHIDEHLQQIQGTHPLTYISAEARRIKLLLVPVTGLSRRAEYRTAVAQVIAADGRGACIRVTPDEVLRSSFAADVKNHLRRLSVSAENSDLLVDWQDFDPEKPTIQQLLDRIPLLGVWRTLTVASGAFPKDLQQYKDPGRYAIPRNDWLAWRRALEQKGLPRKPSFSDYTIQYGCYKEPPDIATRARVFVMRSMRSGSSCVVKEYSIRMDLAPRSGLPTPRCCARVRSSMGPSSVTGTSTFQECAMVPKITAPLELGCVQALITT